MALLVRTVSLFGVPLHFRFTLEPLLNEPLTFHRQLVELMEEQQDDSLCHNLLMTRTKITRRIKQNEIKALLLPVNFKLKCAIKLFVQQVLSNILTARQRECAERNRANKVSLGLVQNGYIITSMLTPVNQLPKRTRVMFLSSHYTLRVV